MGKYNWKQISLVGVMLLMISYAWSEYGIGGGLLFVVIGMVMLRLFFNALSTENNIPLPAGEYIHDGFEGDPNYDPMLASFEQNIYHKD